MKAGTYTVEAAIEESHWWFFGRRRLFARELAQLAVPQDAQVLDIGTSTGSNLRMLSDLGFKYVAGVDVSDDAIRYCAGKGFGYVKKGDVCALPFDDGIFDVVLATDIIEHVDDDDLALAEIARVLKPGGRVLITVPAFGSLWGLQDEVALHKRRYRIMPLLKQLKRVGLKPLRRYYFNYLLFGPIWLARQLIRILRVRVDSENEINTPALNQILKAIFLLDTLTAPTLRMPFGVSILVMAEAGARG
jgi:SAM-dependent methyltransferase